MEMKITNEMLQDLSAGRYQSPTNWIVKAMAEELISLREELAVVEKAFGKRRSPKERARLEQMREEYLRG